jgi:hypothetical protein
MPDIVLKWQGREYRIPEARAFEAGAALEEVVTLAQVQSWATNPRFFVIAKATGLLLRFAGCKVSDAEVKQEIDRSIAKAAAQGVTEDDAKELFAIRAMQQLVAVLFDGAPDGEDGEAPEKPSASSKPRSKSR